MKPIQKSKKLQLIHLLFPFGLGKIKGISVSTTLLQLFGAGRGGEAVLKSHWMVNYYSFHTKDYEEYYQSKWRGFPLIHCFFCVLDCLCHCFFINNTSPLCGPRQGYFHWRSSKSPIFSLEAARADDLNEMSHFCATVLLFYANFLSYTCFRNPDVLSFISPFVFSPVNAW